MLWFVITPTLLMSLQQRYLRRHCLSTRQHSGSSPQPSAECLTRATCQSVELLKEANTKLLKLNAGWLKEGDEWPVKKLPAAWRSPGFNAEKLEERMRSLQGYFQTFAEWATRLRSRP